LFKQKLSGLAMAGVIGLNFVNPNLALKMPWAQNPQKVQERIEERIENAGTTSAIQNRLQNRLENFLNRRAVIASAKITAINGSTLIVNMDGKDYNVLTDDKTKFRRRFWGKSELSEFSVNDLVNVIGRWNNEERTEIKAVLIRNLSIQKRWGVFIGTVKSVSENGFVLTSLKRGDETVVVDSSTKLVNRKMETISLADILVGHRVRVKGMWDSANKTITEVVQVKDFSLPVLPSPSPKAE